MTLEHAAVQHDLTTGVTKEMFRTGNGAGRAEELDGGFACHGSQSVGGGGKINASASPREYVYAVGRACIFRTSNFFADAIILSMVDSNSPVAPRLK